ncbi:hypothetical protein Pla52o_57410 [Novipirellula galeiformis]|uniref:Lipoprotein n=1 Tax=Novipirellula galeiformis TaxID=2528004 RepID=A0A5C6BDJ3_9BACT|nr:hypothetical protein [Novipirellula galeiformis]TWU10285.1 hypothetical protein Pla52o_57410 [Novipirellula galeiformis]
MRTIVVMGLLSFIFGCNHPEKTVPAVTIDLLSFSVAGNKVGKPVAADLPFARELADSSVYAPRGKGLELGANGGSLDRVFVTLGEFDGTFFAEGKPLELHTATSEQDIRERFGDPYWTDREDGEVILFYEYQDGNIEVQYEFPDGMKLGFITISRAGVLSDPEQRKLYGVDKAWPPQ